MSTLANGIVDVLLEGDPAEFMRQFGKTWHADYTKDALGWYHVTWRRGLEIIDDTDLKLSQAQIKWLEAYYDWLDKVFPFDRYAQSGGDTISTWNVAARGKGYLKRYLEQTGLKLPPIKEAENILKV